MKQKTVSIDWEKCGNPELCEECEVVQIGFIDQCRKHGGVTFADGGWVEFEVIDKLLKRCPKDAIKVK